MLILVVSTKIIELIIDYLILILFYIFIYFCVKIKNDIL